MVFDDGNWPISVSITCSVVRNRWAIVDLVGKGGHVRTVPVPDWVKQFLDEWFTAAKIRNCFGVYAAQERYGATV